MRLEAVNIANLTEIPYKGRIIRTGIFKTPVSGQVRLEPLGLEGDTIVDLKHHGGYDQAVYGYASEHYDYWKEKYPDLEWETGMFGENLTIAGLFEDELHVGDQLSIGTAILEVTKPREPCIKLGLRFETQDILEAFWNASRSGVYFKVVQPGTLAAGDPVRKILSNPDKPTIAAVYESRKHKK
jgi:MOSC domain-containing protein YiiM